MTTAAATLPLTVVVPVYNGAATLETLALRLRETFSGLGRAGEIVFVDDGSRDGSWETILGLSLRFPEARGIRLMRNYGQHNAVLCGLRAARHPLIVTMDDDLQNPPEEIPLLLAKLEEGFDVVYGSPAAERHGFWRDLASRLTKRVLQAAMGVEIARSVSAFRALRAEVLAASADYESSFISIDVLLTWGTNRFAAVPVRHETRANGASNYTFFRLVTHAFNMLTGFSVLPLQIASLLGFSFAFFGLLVLTYVVGRYTFQGSPVPGFPFLASITAIFSGTQLFALGILGEYMARMHFRSMGRPQYVVRNDTRGPA
jgi:glycosyltransferase involved in cell wall biosynthesis